MGTTTNYGWAYPETTDAADGPAQFASLAQDIDTTVKAIENKTLFVRKTADEIVNNSTSLQNDDHLVLAVAADSVYIVEAFLIYRANVSADFKLAFTWPASATMSFGSIGGDLDAGGGDNNTVKLQARQRATSGSTTLTYASIGTGSETSLRVTGLLITGATAGNLQLKWAQNTAHASDAILMEDSWLSLRKVG